MRVVGALPRLQRLRRFACHDARCSGPVRGCRVVSGAGLRTGRMRKGRQAGAGCSASIGRGDERRAARRSAVGRVHRADAEFAGRQYPGAGLRLPRQAHVHRGLDGQGRYGAVRDGQETFPGAGGRRTRPLTELNALSQKDLDDAQGRYEQAAAAVEQAKAQLIEAKLNLSYTTIVSPVTGITGSAVVPEGTYVNVTNSQLTTVSVLSPMWIDFSVSENQIERIRDDVAKGRIRLPAQGSFVVEIEMADGKRFPYTGRITFADPSYNPRTGTFLIRASVQNPEGVLRPNQYVRARLLGAFRPNAILVPQRAVQQGAQGRFVWVVGADGKVQPRPVVVGDWYGDSWFINEGLSAGDRVVVDGALRLAPGVQVDAVPYAPPPSDAAPAPPAGAGVAR